MATTTNYSWTTPDDTALVKDGAAAIRTLGSSVDTTVKNLNPETTLGDIAYRSSTANVKTRLGLGTAGQVLTVNSGANAPEWATPSSGGMTLISTTTLSGATTTLSSIPQTYNSLYLVITGVTGNTSDNRLRCLPNNVNNLSNYTGMHIADPTTFGQGFAVHNEAIRLVVSASTDRTDPNNSFAFTIDNYTSSTRYKPFEYYGFYVNSSGGVSNNVVIAGGAFRSNTAITSLVFDYGGTNTFAGGTVLLYGVK
jgi:hypothetical protein